MITLTRKLIRKSESRMSWKYSEPHLRIITVCRVTDGGKHKTETGAKMFEDKGGIIDMVVMSIFMPHAPTTKGKRSKTESHKLV